MTFYINNLFFLFKQNFFVSDFMTDSRKKKEYFFLLFLKRSYTEEANENVEFTNSEDKSNIPKCILTKEINGYIIKVFKFSKELQIKSR